MNVAAVSVADVQRAAARYLGSEQRSIAWYVPAENAELVNIASTDRAPAAVFDRPLRDPGGHPIGAPVVKQLSSGIPVIVQHSDLSSTALLQIVLPSNQTYGTVPDVPIAGHSSLNYSVRPNRIDAAILQARDALEALQPALATERARSGDPAILMERAFADLMGGNRLAPDIKVLPSLISVVGDVNVDKVLQQLETSFGALQYTKAVATKSQSFSSDTLILSTGIPVAQAQLGYIVAAPAPSNPRSDAWRLLLHILSHDYEGRLGKKAISEAGLAYYIGSEYRSDGSNAWISLSTGVDTNKIAPLDKLLRAELKRLATEPPTDAEIADAKSNRLGRLKSSAQSNAELASQLATQWLWYGEILSVDSLAERLAAISRQDVLDEIALFGSGKVIVVAE